MFAYISVPEPVNDGVGFVRRLFFEIIRAALKGLSHQAAHVFDHVTFTRPRLPPSPPQNP